jgi:hypothetical protein
VTFTTRRLRNGFLALLVLLVLTVGVGLLDLALRDTSFLTGWLLVGAFAVLAAYNLRKKLPMLPLLRSATWLQFHVYLGLVTAGLFVLHTGPRLPDGALETGLWLVVVVLILSGLAGIAITRVVPRGLTAHGERPIFERIPAFRAQLAQEAGDIVTRALEAGASQSLASYYARRLHPYFARPRHLGAHLLGSRRPVQRICRELRALERYIARSEQESLEALEDRVIAKDNLDYQYAWQSLLKGWLFVHIPLTYAAFLAAAVHVVLVYAFGAEAL